MPDRVLVFDTTLRDGEQSPGVHLTMPEKLEIGHQLVRLGVDVIEGGFPISSPGDFDSVHTLAQELKGVTICGLSRARRQDIEVAAEAIRPAERGRIHTGLGVSDNHLRHKLRMTREQGLEAGVGAVKIARQFTDDVEYYMEDAGRADPEYVFTVVDAVIRAGATTLNVPDTTGYTTPEEYAAIVRGILEHVPDGHEITVSCHCHNDLGMATANTLAGVHAGARQVEVTVNGIGERAGNTSLEEVCAALLVRSEFFQVETGINPGLLMETSRLVAQRTGMMVQRNKAVVGANAYAHSSGIHQDGVLKERTTYEIIDPRLVGAEKSEIILTARSGRHGLRHRLAEMGFSFPEDRFEALYAAFLAVADTKAEVTGDDLSHALAAH